MHQSPYKQGWTLSRLIGAFSALFSLLCVFLLSPFGEIYIRPKIEDHLSITFSYDLALYGSWVFILVLSACCFFAIAAMMQLIIQLLLRKLSRGAGY